MEQRRRRLTYANVMSTIAAFVAVAGSTAYASQHLGRDSVGTVQLRPDSVTGAKVRNGSLGGADINVQGLPTVPSATSATEAKHAASAGQADHAANADHAAKADNAATAEHATNADHAADADHATNADHSARADTAALAESLAPPEAPHLVSEPGEPRFEAAYEFVGGPPSFYMDREGVVHLEGRLISEAKNPGVMFTLPPAYRPRDEQLFHSISAIASIGVRVNESGDVESPNIFESGIEISLDGISWRPGTD